MRLLERILLVILGLLIITLLTVIFIAPQTVADLMITLQNINIAIRLAVVLVLDAFILALLYVRLRPQKIDANSLVVKASGVVADISIDSARGHILRAVRAVPDVTEASAELQAVQGRADIELDVTVAGDEVNVPGKQQEINRALQQVITKQLGLQIYRQPRVHIHLDSEKLVAEKREEQPAPKPVESARPIVAAPVTPSPVAVDKPSEKPGSGSGLSALLHRGEQAEAEAEADGEKTLVPPPEMAAKAQAVEAEPADMPKDAKAEEAAGEDDGLWLRSFLQKDQDEKDKTPRPSDEDRT